MGQYWFPVNLTKREFVDPHKLGTGLKLREQLASHPGTGAALVILCAAMPEPRGGGDLQPSNVVGRWAGDRIALVGDYAEDGDIKNSPYPASAIYAACQEGGEFRDISDLVCQVISRELGGRFTGEDGTWKRYVEEGDTGRP